MKVSIFLGVVLLFQYGLSSWVTELFSELNVEENVKKVLDNETWFGLVDTVGEYATKIKKDGLRSMNPELKKTLEYVKTNWKHANKVAGEKSVRYVQKIINKKNKVVQTVDKKKVYLISQWNDILQKMNDFQGNNIEKVKGLLHKFKKVSNKLAKFLPEDMFATMKSSATGLVLKFEEKTNILPKSKDVRKISKNGMVKDLKKQIIEWTQPSFMKKIEEVNDKSLENKEEDKMNSWVKKYFVKPHRDSSSEPHISKETLEAIKKEMPFKVPDEEKEPEKEIKPTPNMPIVIDIIMPYERAEPPKQESEKIHDSANADDEDDKRKEKKIKKQNIHKGIFTGNEDWDVYKQFQKKKLVDEKLKEKKAKIAKDSLAWLQKKIAGKKFGKDLSDLDSKWFGIKKSAFALLKKMQKYKK